MERGNNADINNEADSSEDASEDSDAWHRDGLGTAGVSGKVQPDKNGEFKLEGHIDLAADGLYHGTASGQSVVDRSLIPGKEMLAFQDTAGSNPNSLTELFRSVIDKSREGHHTRTDSTEAHDQLLDDAKKEMGENSPAYREFAENIRKFEERAKHGQVSPQELAETYRQVDRLITTDHGKVPEQQRILLAENIMFHAGSPKDIDQGHYKTCNATTLEEKMMTTHPSKAAEMIASAAIDGQWKAGDGKVIKIDPQSLVPMPESRRNPPADGDRSFATQLLNNVLANDVAQRRNPPEFYKQIHDINGRPLPDGDNGERLVDASGRVLSHGPHMGTGDMADEMKRLTGETRFILCNTQLDKDDRIVPISSAEDLRAKLIEMKPKFPLIIVVDANWPLFGGPRQDGVAGHVVTITGFDEKTGMVQISNQWGKSSDVTVPLNDLYKATTPYRGEDEYLRSEKRRGKGGFIVDAPDLPPSEIDDSGEMHD